MGHMPYAAIVIPDQPATLRGLVRRLFSSRKVSCFSSGQGSCRPVCVDTQAGLELLGTQMA
ncbi:hypothetical protein DPMN_046443 [Dreissena polymorpha]|uniref:Uncharacterized protein n=1 Tax=Dreissena polymorpha TaxID=45954 RepID=A0A9D4D5X4_DREPO|nr:hypothetical protein DPMN_046443 [Dreissena polymorpha]